jgi:hypothetical protein
MIQQLTIEQTATYEKKFGYRFYFSLSASAKAQSETRTCNNEYSSAESSAYSQTTTPLPHSGSLINGQNKTRTAR